MKRRNMRSLQALGGMSAEIQESLQQLQGHRRVQPPRLLPAQVQRPPTNATTPPRSSAGIANNVFMPLYGFAYNLAQLIVLAYGIYLIGAGSSPSAC